MTSVTRPEELDARGRRLRAALAAVLVRDNAAELRLMHDWLDNSEPRWWGSAVCGGGPVKPGLQP
jgi:hypothetical protein